MTRDRSDSLLRYLGRAWSDTIAPIRRAATGMWTAGAVLIGAGLAFDFLDLWGRFPFLVNISSAVVGALFAVPLAVIVLQEVARYQATTVVQNQETRRLTESHAAFAAALARFGDAAAEVTGSPDLPEVRRAHTELAALLHDARSMEPVPMAEVDAAWQVIDRRLERHINAWSATHTRLAVPVKALLAAWAPYRSALNSGSSASRPPHPPVVHIHEVDDLLAKAARASERDPLLGIQRPDDFGMPFDLRLQGALSAAERQVEEIERVTTGLRRRFGSADTAADATGT